MKRAFLVVLLLFPLILFAQRNRSLELIGGLAVQNGTSGYHVGVAGGRQGEHFGMAISSHFLNTPGNKFSNWSIMGLQMKGLFGDRPFKPYGLFDFALFNLQTINDDVNMRTIAFNLGGGIDKPFARGDSAFLADIRWKWLVDYKGERTAIRVFMVSFGIRF